MSLVCTAVEPISVHSRERNCEFSILAIWHELNTLGLMVRRRAQRAVSNHGSRFGLAAILRDALASLGLLRMRSEFVKDSQARTKRPLKHISVSLYVRDFFRFAASALSFRKGRERGQTSARKCTKDDVSASSLRP